MREIKRIDLESINYYQVPKWLMDLFISGKISAGAFKTYVLMYERLRISDKNNWIDEEGTVYIKYSYDEMQKDLKISRQAVSNNLKDLIELDLIVKVKNFNSSSKFYLKIYDSSSKENFTSKENLTNSSKEELTTSSKENLTNSSLLCLDANKNNSSNNNFSKNNSKKNNSTQDILNALEQESVSFELKEKIKEFIDYRKEINKPIKTYKVISMMLKQIGIKFTNEQHLILSIDDAIANQYQGVFPVKVNNLKGNTESIAMKRLKEIRGIQ